MNLTDLREELTARAAESDEHPSDLLAGVHRKIIRTKRRRVAGVLVGTAAVAALSETWYRTYVPTRPRSTPPMPPGTGINPPSSPIR